MRSLLRCLVAIVSVGTLGVSLSPGSSGAIRHRPAAGCRAASSRSAVPFEATGSHGRVPMVSVCIDGHGPYPFVISSGAGVSLLAPSLARKLHLRSVASIVPLLGDTCVASAREVFVRKWSMGGLALATQGVLVAKIPAASLHPAPLGVIGSDVLSRFSAIEVDYRTRRVRLQYHETLSPSSTTYVIGKATTELPPTFVKGRPTSNVALTELTGPTGTTISAPVSIGTAPGGAGLSFAVDSGSPWSSVVESVAKSLALSPAGGAEPEWGAGCNRTVPGVASGSWSVHSTELSPVRLSVVTVAGGVNQSLRGVLGANVLGGSGAYVIDYENAHLWLGVRR